MRMESFNYCSNSVCMQKYFLRQNHAPYSLMIIDNEKLKELKLLWFNRI